MKRFILFLALAFALSLAGLAQAAPVDNIQDQTINGKWRFNQETAFKKAITNQDAPIKSMFWNGTDWLTETILESYPVSKMIDFLEANATIPSANGQTDYAYSLVKNGTADILDATPPGIVRLSANASLYSDNNLMLDMTKGVFFEARVKLPTQPTDVSSASWGLAGNATSHDAKQLDWFALFQMSYGGSVNATSKGLAKGAENSTTGHNPSTTVFDTYRIECSNTGVITWYINGKMAGNSTKAWIGQGGRNYVQPYFNLNKPAGTPGVGVMDVDYVRYGQMSR